MLPKAMDASTARPTAGEAFLPVEQLVAPSKPQRLTDFSGQYFSYIAL